MEKFTFQGHSKITHPNGSDSSHWYSFKCAFCNIEVSGAVVAFWGSDIKWLQCPNCGHGSVYNRDDKAVVPGVPYGNFVQGLPAKVESAYEEARRCMSVNAFTSTELLCRNILMYVAVDKGAEENRNFAFYIDYLATSGYVTPPMKPWVEKIREHGNKAAHELEDTDKNRASSTIQFTEALLKLIYEMEHLTKNFAPQLKGSEPK